jgi:hypothetical protein
MYLRARCGERLHRDVCVELRLECHSGARCMSRYRSSNETRVMSGPAAVAPGAAIRAATIDAFCMRRLICSSMVARGGAYSRRRPPRV